MIKLNKFELEHLISMVEEQILKESVSVFDIEYNINLKNKLKKMVEEYDKDYNKRGQLMTERYEQDIDNLLSVWDTEKNRRLEIEDIVELLNQNEKIILELKQGDLIFFQQVWAILMKYQYLFNRKMADEILEELGIELTEWFE